MAAVYSLDTSTLQNAAISAEQYIGVITLNLALIVGMKIVVLSLGFATVFLGYRLLLQGIRGEFKFKSELAGAKADLASISPGTFFVLLGVALMGSAMCMTYAIPIKQSIGVPDTALMPVAPLPEDEVFRESSSTALERR